MGRSLWALGLDQHEDGAGIPKARIQFSSSLVTWHASEATSSSAINLRARAISPNVELLRPSPNLYL